MTAQPDLWSAQYMNDPRAGRDRILDALQLHRAEIIARLRHAAWKHWNATGEPVCVNDIRHVLRETGFAGDARVLGAVFTKAEGWVPVGWTQVKGSAAHARPIRLFAPIRLPPERAV